VQLWVQNLGTAEAGLDRLIDNLTGFQAIRKASEPLGTAGEYAVSPAYVAGQRRCDVTLDLDDGSGGPLPLPPGESIIVEYLAVPVLYANPDPDQYTAGEQFLQVRYQDGTSWINVALDRPTTTTAGYTPLVTEVSNARAAANYLIASNPSLLFVENPSMPDAVNELLSAMAELAQLKAGILGDVAFSGPLIGPGWLVPSYGAAYVKTLLDQWGLGMRGGDGLPGHHPQNGYVLLVGETDTLPAIDLSKSGWTVHLSDLWYGDTNNDWPNPERVVGRIVGDDVAKLTIPIQTSINVHNSVSGYHFDRAKALSLAGRGDGLTLFELSAWQVANVLDQEFDDVDLLFQKDVEDAGLNIKDVFRSYAYEQDVIFYRDHSSTSSWGDGSTVVDTADLAGANPIDFGSAKPFVFGCACLSGNYSGVSLAEAFLQDGAGVYIGATEVSDRLWNNKSCLRLYAKWVNSTRTIGKALRDTKRDITEGDWASGYEGDRWAAMYNLYGDPKYGGAPVAGSDLASAGTVTAEPPATISVEVPDYEVTNVDGMDYVDIPGGNTFFELGKPLVPIFTVETEIPEGFRVQDVQLASRSGLTTATGLNLPLAVLEWDAPGAAAAAAELEAGWWPEPTFDWEIQENAGGGSTLTLRL
ncbi:MAG: C25 family cysteine peptidase, partial [Anaerolineae bacterium]|nr:C25 family cysteine peptidase [Anaerolineae bacterium]